MYKSLCVTVALAVSMLISGCSGSYKEGPLGSADNPIQMAFTPSRDVREIVPQAQKLADELKKSTGLHFEISVPVTYAETVQAMKSGRVQVGWLSPLSYLAVSELTGAQAVLVAERSGQTSYNGIILVRSDSNIRDVSQLKGKKIALVDPLSTSGTLYPLHLLRAKGLNVDTDIETFYAGGHDKAIISLYNKQADACACYADGKGDARDRVASSTIPDVKKKTMVLAKTESIPNDNVTFSKDIPEKTRAKIVEGLMAISNTKEGKDILQAVSQIDAFQQVSDDDYAGVRKIIGGLGVDIQKLLNQRTPQEAIKT